MAVVYNLVQSDTDNSADPGTATFGTVPVSGNLLVAIGMERSGTGSAAATISGSGWTKSIARDASAADSTYRRSLSVWWKQAGASEPTTISYDDGTSNLKRLLILEFESGDPITWDLVGSSSNDNGNTADATSIATGTTASLAAADLLQIGICAIKTATGTSFTVTWSSDDLTNGPEAEATGSNDRAMFSGWAQQSSAGTRASTCNIDLGGGTNNGLVAGILVFAPTGGGGGSSPPPRVMLPPLAPPRR